MNFHRGLLLSLLLLLLLLLLVEANKTSALTGGGNDDSLRPAKTRLSSWEGEIRFPLQLAPTLLT